MQTFEVQGLVKLTYRLFALVNEEIFSIIEQKTSVLAVNSTWLVAGEKVLRLVTILPQKYHLTGYKRKSLTDL